MEEQIKKIKFCDDCEKHQCKTHYDGEGDRIDRVFCEELNRIVYQYSDDWDKADIPNDCPLSL
ncbi:hypothetical protein [Clostridium botulinum]|uniref:Uncharacterized protein n=2 Tax=Clostridium botulinum TaxID=1491 RepID=C1FRB4_CLOBJ|nr:hypothetical protein [Clostridium botulinum]ACO84976.1 hypothetical protein CLM_2548 [Clostridium botulinum A2 str. Kyoto]AUN07436.1 hypothetical protein RSJ14_12315 [Clostridium botulinum]AUN18232.1 hypothetical protein B2M06_11745 [Clostridium botulinum]MBN3364290.1 hypothetical protein [Clostridium botulinum]MBN3368464.1 hypothetical protein [Clostridium botulinum]